MINWTNVVTQVYDRSIKNQVTGIEDDVEEKPKEGGIVHDITNGKKLAVVEFKAARSSVLEKEGKVRIGIKRFGKLDCEVPVR